MRLLSCRCSSGRVRNSFPSNQNGRKSFGNTLVVAAYNLGVWSPDCCLHTRHPMLPLACWAAAGYLQAAGNLLQSLFLILPLLSHSISM